MSSLFFLFLPWILAELQRGSLAYATSTKSLTIVAKANSLPSVYATSILPLKMPPLHEPALGGPTQLKEVQFSVAVSEPVSDQEPLIPTISPSPLIPIFPNPSPPLVSGRCPLNFSTVAETLARTAQDCPAPLAAYVGNVICCPQLESLVYIIQGQHGRVSGQLSFNTTEAAYCYSDTLSLLESQGANRSISDICSFQVTNLTGGSCPVKDAAQFVQLVNTTKLLAACRTVDPLQECCDPVCQPSLTQAAMVLASQSPPVSLDHHDTIAATSSEILNDCTNVVLAWLSGQLGPASANTALRNLFSCKVNEECPLSFNDPSPVVRACGGVSPSVNTCCSELHNYISGIQQETFITDLQALHCVTLLGLMLQKDSVTANVYELCNIDLKDFSLQGNSDQGCLLNSLPSDVVNNKSGISFTCDLNNNIPAPWPPISTLTLCSRNASVPTVPSKVPSSVPGFREVGALGFILTGFVIIHLTRDIDAIARLNSIII